RRGQAPVDVDVGGGIGVGAGGVVQVEMGAVAESDAAVRHAERRTGFGVGDLVVDLLRTHDGAGGHLLSDVTVVKRRQGTPPYVGITRTGSAVGGTGPLLGAAALSARQGASSRVLSIFRTVHRRHGARRAVARRII